MTGLARAVVEASCAVALWSAVLACGYGWLLVPGLAPSSAYRDAQLGASVLLVTWPVLVVVYWLAGRR